jgi:hypothetical protein
VKRKKETPAAASAGGATGPLPAAGSRQLSTRTPGVSGATPTVPAQAPVKARKGKAAARDDDDDLGDVADILRRHGIT